MLFFRICLPFGFCFQSIFCRLQYSNYRPPSHYRKNSHLLRVPEMFILFTCHSCSNLAFTGNNHSLLKHQHSPFSFALSSRWEISFSISHCRYYNISHTRIQRNSIPDYIEFWFGGASNSDILMIDLQRLA